VVDPGPECSTLAPRFGLIASGNRDLIGAAGPTGLEVAVIG